MTPNVWSVTVDLVGRTPTEQDADRLVDDLAAHHTIVSTGDRCLSAILTITAADATTAVHQAAQLVTTAAGTGWTIEYIQAMTDTRLDLELATPTIPELVGLSEAAEILGVSRQRAHALAKTAGFPTPVQELAAGPVWRRTAVEAFAAIPRRSGRPAAVEPITR